MPSIRQNLEQRYRECPYCAGEGLVTIYHDRYTGKPYVELKTRRGEVRRFALLLAIPCICPLGSFMRDERTNGEATKIQELNLNHVLEGHIKWSIYDPTLPKIDDGEVPEPGRLRSMIEKMSSAPKRARDVLREQRKREQENWMVRFLVNALEAGPLAFAQIAQRARDAGHGSLADLRTAGELVRVKITSAETGEVWSLE
jgi:hypothetical protein